MNFQNIQLGGTFSKVIDVFCNTGCNLGILIEVAFLIVIGPLTRFQSDIDPVSLKFETSAMSEWALVINFPCKLPALKLMIHYFQRSIPLLLIVVLCCKLSSWVLKFEFKCSIYE